MAKKTTNKANVGTSKTERLFEDYPNVKELYMTTDSMAFFTENDAKNHAISLKDGEVKTIKRK